MPYFNNVVLVGYINKRGVEVRQTSKMAVATFGITVREKWGKKVDDIHFQDCVVFGNSAEAAGKYLAAGDCVLVHGKLKTEQYEKDGKNIVRVKLMVSSWKNMSPRVEQGATPPPGDYSPDDDYQGDDYQIPF